MACAEKSLGACPDGGAASAELTRDWLLSEMRAAALRSLELQLEQQERLVARFMDHAGGCAQGEPQLWPVPGEESPKITPRPDRARRVAQERDAEPAGPDVVKLAMQVVRDRCSAAAANGCVVAVSQTGIAASEFKRWRINIRSQH